MSSFDPELRATEKRRRRWLPFIVVLCVVAGAVIASNLGIGRRFFEYIDQQAGGDKAGHFFLIGGLALTLNFALRGRLVRLGPFSLQFGGVIVAAVMTIEELSQYWIPLREFDWGDLLANYAGILCADWLARRWVR